MKIKEVTITEKELITAVEEWFKNHFGLEFRVEDVEKPYSYSVDYKVTVKTEEKVPTEVAAAMIEAKSGLALAELKENE